MKNLQETVDHSVVASLLNLYREGDDERPTGSRPSRGEIILDVLSQGELSAATAWAENHLEPGRYPSFSLALFSFGRSTVFSWDGETFSRHDSDEAWRVLSSSGWRSEEVLSFRRRAFEVWREGGAPIVGSLPAVHCLQPAGRAQWAPLMERGTTCTRNITQVELLRGEACATLRYWPDPTALSEPQAELDSQASPADGRSLAPPQVFHLAVAPSVIHEGGQALCEWASSPTSRKSKTYGSFIDSRARSEFGAGRRSLKLSIRGVMAWRS